jgi:ABC-2 type transport system ATP-binding protein
MRQRVGLAQALLHEPDVLILDEPTLGLDPGQIIEVRNMIKEIGRQRTVLLSTHILSEAQQVCDRVLIINKGRIIAEDSPERLQAHMTGAQRGILKVRGETDALVEILGSVAGITEVTALEEGQVEYNAAPGQEVRPEVARVVINAGFDLLELRTVGVSLEEIFLELTRENEADPPSSEAPDLHQEPGQRPDEGLGSPDAQEV